MTEISAENFEKIRAEFEGESQHQELVKLVENEFVARMVGVVAQCCLEPEAIEELLRLYLEKRRESEEESIEKAKGILGDRVEFLLDKQQEILEEAEENLRKTFGLSG